jgi:hypothetical protein
MAGVPAKLRTAVIMLLGLGGLLEDLNCDNSGMVVIEDNFTRKYNYNGLC